MRMVMFLHILSTDSKLINKEKKMKKLLIISIFTFVVSILSTSANATKDCTSGADVNVNGLVCDFCARALEKVFSKQEEVAGINVDLDNALVAVDYNQGKSLSDETLTALITDSGYDVVEVNQRNCK